MTRPSASTGRAAPQRRAQRHARRARRQGGVLIILFALTLPVLLCLAGMALDLALLFQRRVQLQNMADSVALAAARSLNGTPAGVNAAVAQALGAATGQEYGSVQAAWTPAALTFSADPDLPDAAWVGAAAAAADAALLRYAKVDTGQLTDGRGTLTRTLSALMGTGPLVVAARAVAGRARLPVTPLAICAMGPDTAVRDNSGLSEDLRHGFRQGVSYNLLDLNPEPGSTAGAYFLVDPIQDADAALAPVQNQTSDAVLAPYMCSGSVQLARVTGATLRLRQPAAFNLATQLNSRFGDYGAGAQACTPAAAPPDSNVKQYAGAGASWMVPLPAGASAAPGPAGAPGGPHPHNTVADRAKAPLNTSYGPLWAFGPARQPGGAAINRSQWPLLYPVEPGGGAAPAAPTYTPPAYSYTSGANFLAPPQPGLPQRRVLFIPLLQCAVPGGVQNQGLVVAVARFFMVAKANGTSVSAEFAGVVNERGLQGAVELYR
jgi:hypothetical protein